MYFCFYFSSARQIAVAIVLEWEIERSIDLNFSLKFSRYFSLNSTFGLPVSSWEIVML